MNRLLVVVSVISTSAAAQCQTDADCKGSRVCVQRQCTSAPSNVASGSEGNDIIKTRDGRTLVGRILRETPTGYFFQTLEGATEVVELSAIVELRNASAGRPSSAPVTSDAPRLDAAGRSARLLEVQNEIRVLTARIEPFWQNYLSMVVAGIAIVGGAIMVALASSTLNLVFGITFIAIGVLGFPVQAIFIALKNARNEVLNEKIRALRREEEQLQRADLRLPPPPVLFSWSFRW